MFDKYFEKRRKIKEIREKYKDILPKYSPFSGKKLEWDIDIIYNGFYSIKTGKPFEKPQYIFVTKKGKIYRYSIDNGLEINWPWYI